MLIYHSRLQYHVADGDIDLQTGRQVRKVSYQRAVEKARINAVIVLDFRRQQPRYGVGISEGIINPQDMHLPAFRVIRDSVR